jgi:hypothetical protein
MEMDVPLYEDGVWYLDISFNGHEVVVGWSKATAFGVSRITADIGLGEGHDEVYGSLDQVEGRITELLTGAGIDASMTNTLDALARDQFDAVAARGLVWHALNNANSHRAVYSALCRWTWMAMTNKSHDESMSAWQHLLLDAADRIAAQPDVLVAERQELDTAKVAERTRALVDLLGLAVAARGA